MSDRSAIFNYDIGTALDQLAELYRGVDAEVASHHPVCELSARPRLFREYGHDLFLTSPEHELLIRDGEPAVGRFMSARNCPWQATSGMCNTRADRPLGCYVHYCDPNNADLMPGIMESAITNLKQIHVQADIPWDYRPLHQFMIESRAQGRWTEPVQAQCDTVGTATDNGGGQARDVSDSGLFSQNGN